MYGCYEGVFKVLQIKIIPYLALREESGVPVFWKRDVDLYGKPELWGLEIYQCVELREDQEYKMEWKDEKERRLRPKHLYCRVERFKGVLMELIGVKGVVENEVLDVLKNNFFDPSRSGCWNSIRGILKKEGLTRYYNRIPTILQRLGLEKRLKLEDECRMVGEIIRDFQRISRKFDERDWERTYFPNLRFCALKYLELAGMEFKYEIPFLRTPRKLKESLEVWNILIQ